ncbi:hypothetical protein WT12_08245 [Burkholderia territorii]|uniref:hypothetical protein n=1 Tax=Burkholderia territorii TaxID=1503055 RepID=UPI00075D2F72|nr:hypothetical protein [Burkholderia territorii]KVN48728.1 hypothetical protein WT12_08245 [Burkholderia territorii]
MISEINGKKLAFGMEWRLLVESGAFATIAARRARELNSPLHWHDGKADYAGFLSKADASGSQSGQVFAAAAAFLRVPGLPENALLLIRTPDDKLSLIGVRQRKPMRRFDQVGLSEEQANDLYVEFGKKCGAAGFAVVGETNLSFVSEATPFTLIELAEYADSSCLLKQPRRSGFYKKVAVAGVAVAWLAFMAPRAIDYFFPPDPIAAKSPAEWYAESLKAHALDPVVKATDFASWYDWTRSLSPMYGGWMLSKVSCDFRAPGSQGSAYQVWSGRPQCVLTYDRVLKVYATNQTFITTAPKEYASSASYVPSSDQMIVNLSPFSVKKASLNTMLNAAGTSADRQMKFMSTIQSANLLVKATLSDAEPFLVPPGVQPAGIASMLYRTSHWRMEGASHYVKILADFPAYATLSKAELTINKTNDQNDTPYQISIEGEAVTRN